MNPEEQVSLDQKTLKKEEAATMKASMVKKPEPMYRVVLKKKMRRPQTYSDLFKLQAVNQQLLESQLFLKDAMSPYTASLQSIGLKVRKIKDKTHKHKKAEREIKRMEAEETEATAR